jgi:hypothetical protein
MPRLPPTDEQLSVSIPTPLLDRVRIELLDPRTGKARYGSMRSAVTEALTLWLRGRQ